MSASEAIRKCRSLEQRARRMGLQSAGDDLQSWAGAILDAPCMAPFYANFIGQLSDWLDARENNRANQ